MAKSAAEVGSTENRYQILGRLAVGGMAEIFLARGAGVTGVERYCVLKRILPERADDAQFVQMFLDEARLAAQLQHPNIASVYDIGMLGDSYFFTMEYVHGETVRSLVQRALELRRPLPLACVLTIIAGTAAGLHHAHDRNGNDGRPLGIVHRDISPSNLMVSFEGNVKIVDFGVAKADDRAKTQSGMVKGKIGYLSPQQCRGQRVDRRSDLFSLGIVMWEMLTGTRLYRKANDFENMQAIVHDVPPPPSSRRPEVPRTIDDIVLRLLAKSAADRFQTAQEVVEAIEHAALRAGMILSTSAVSRLIRDLFGTRAEPWLELDAEPSRLRSVTLRARPIPRELARATADPAEAELAAVADLSTASMSDRTDPPLEPSDAPPLAASAVAEDPASPSISTWKDPPPAGAAPSPDPAVTFRMSGAAVPPRRAAPSAAHDRRSAPAIAPASLAMATPSAASLPEPASIGVVAPPAIPWNPPTTGEPALPVRPLATRPPTDRAGIDPGHARTVRAARLGSPALHEIVGEAPATASPSPAGAARTDDARGPSGARPPPTLLDTGRQRWSSTVRRLIAICVLGTALGVIAAWLLAQMGDEPVPADPPAQRVAKGAPTATPEPARPQAAAPLPGDAKGETARGAAAAHDAIDRPEAAAHDTSNALPDNAIESPTESPPPVPTDTPPAASPRHRRPASRRASAPAPGSLPDAEPISGSATESSSPPSSALLYSLFSKRDYTSIVHLCSTTAITADIAVICVLGACHGERFDKADAWLPAIDSKQRNQAIARCLELRRTPGAAGGSGGSSGIGAPAGHGSDSPGDAGIGD